VKADGGEVDNRRNDIGQKLLIGIILGGFGTVMGLFINTLLVEAGAGKILAYENRIELRALQAEVRSQYVSLSNDMNELKILLRRTAPAERINNGGTR